jgi:ABC-type arginine/histidine transport system permease subunit
MKKQPNRWLIFSSLALQIAAVMYVSIRLGQFLDQKNQAEGSSLFVLLFSAMGLLTILWMIYRQSKRFW